MHLSNNVCCHTSMCSHMEREREPRTEAAKALMMNAFQYPNNGGSKTLHHFLINIQQQREAFQRAHITTH